MEGFLDSGRKNMVLLYLHRIEIVPAAEEKQCFLPPQTQQRSKNTVMAPRKPKKEAYGNQSISALKGADRVRKRPGVIFGSNGLEGCEHAVF